jgi:hypothetical protein
MSKQQASNLLTNNSSEWQVWQIERFLNSVRGRIQDGSVWLRINRPYTFTESEESARWQAEDFIGALLARRPWCNGGEVPAMSSIAVL